MFGTGKTEYQHSRKPWTLAETLLATVHYFIVTGCNSIPIAHCSTFAGIQPLTRNQTCKRPAIAAARKTAFEADEQFISVEIF